MQPTIFHKFSSLLTTLVLFALLSTIAVGALSDFQSSYEADKLKIETPEPENTKSEKDEKKVEEDPSDKVSSEIAHLETPALLILSSNLNINSATQSHHPEITTPPPERFSFSKHPGMIYLFDLNGDFT